MGNHYDKECNGAWLISEKGGDETTHGSLLWFLTTQRGHGAQWCGWPKTGGGDFIASVQGGKTRPCGLIVAKRVAGPAGPKVQLG
jgi:hypothetical protein